MQKTTTFAAILAGVALAVAGLAYGAAGVSLNGSGSTLSKPFQETAIEQFKKSHKNITINYGGGSGKGRQDLADMVVDFAGSDSPFKESELEVIFGGAPDRFNAGGIKGIGEVGIVGVAAAIANAVYHATGRRIRSLPITIDKLI